MFSSDEEPLPGSTYDYETSFCQEQLDDTLMTADSVASFIEQAFVDVAGTVRVVVDSISEPDTATGDTIVSWHLDTDGTQSADQLHNAVDLYFSSDCFDTLVGDITIIRIPDTEVWTPVPAAAPEFFRFTITINEEFRAEFLDEFSEAFTSFSSEFTAALDEVYEAVPGEQSTAVQELRPVPYSGSSRESDLGDGSADDTLVVAILETRHFYDEISLMYVLRRIIQERVIGRWSVRFTHFSMGHYFPERDLVRIVDGPSALIGRAEMWKQNAWGTICSSDYRVAYWPTLFCQAKGFPGAVGAATATSADIPVGQDDLHLKNTACKPSANGRQQFSACKNGGDCNHQQDMAVNCEPSVRLTGGQLVREGRVEIYSNGAWGPVCAQSLRNKDWATVACLELGYTAAEAVAYLADSDVTMNDAANATYHNPSCDVTTAGSMLECGQVFDMEACDNTQHVYLRCTEEKQEVPPTLRAPISGLVSCEKTWKVYSDGALIDSGVKYTEPSYIEISQDSEVLAFSCNKKSQGAAIVELSNGVVSDRDWMCTTEEQQTLDWTTSDYNDDSWETPEEVSSYGEGRWATRVSGLDVNTQAKWIWGHTNYGGDVTIYCRRRFEHVSRVALVDGALSSSGVVTVSGSPVCDHRVHTANFPSVACRDMGYPWALGVTHVQGSAADSYGLMNPDACAAVDKGYVTECTSNSQCGADYQLALSCRSRIRLSGGQSDAEGFIEVYRDQQWTGLCDFNPSDDVYERACVELGYAGLHSVTSSVNTHSMPVGYHNPVCSDQHVSLVECVEDLRYKQCTHEYSVYVVCDGDKTELPETLQPHEGYVQCDAGAVSVYADGLLIASGQNHVTVQLPKDADVVAVSCEADEDQSASGVLASFDNGVTTDSSWLCSTSEQYSWTSGYFFPDSDVFIPAVVGEPEDQAYWISAAHSRRQIYCRKQLADYYRVTTLLPELQYTEVFELKNSDEYYDVIGSIESSLGVVFSDVQGSQTTEVLDVEPVSDTEGSLITWVLRTVDYNEELELYNSLTAQIDTGALPAPSTGNPENPGNPGTPGTPGDPGTGAPGGPGVGTPGQPGHPVAPQHFTFVGVSVDWLLMRMADGPVDHIGRLELNLHKQWGTVCDNRYLNAYFGRTFCKSRQYPDVIGGSIARESYGIPPGSGPINLHNPSQCNSIGNNVYDCQKDQYSKDTCDHTRDIAAQCEAKVRLAFGDLVREGRVEMYDAETNEWGSICASSLDNTEWADVLCQELQYSGAEAVEYVSRDNLGWFPPATEFLSKMNPVCSQQTARSMETCGDALHQDACSHDQVIYVRCAAPKAELPIELQKPITTFVNCDSKLTFLADGKIKAFSNNVNRAVQIEIPGNTKTVGIKCESPDYQGGMSAWFDNGVVTDGSWSCTTEEQGTGRAAKTFATSDYDDSLWHKARVIGRYDQAAKWDWLTSGMRHKEETYWIWSRTPQQGHHTVHCRYNFESEPRVRLVGGAAPNEGVVEVKIDGQWGGVCDNSLEDSSWSSLVCEELGFPGLHSVAHVQDTSIEYSTERTALVNPSCDVYTHNYLHQCTSSDTHTCDGSHHVAVVCAPKVRLINGTSESDGIIQWYRDGHWGYISDRSRDESWPRRSCLDLGYSDAEDVMTIRAAKNKYTPKGGYLAGDSPVCAEDAESVDDCQDNELMKPKSVSGSLYLTCAGEKHSLIPVDVLRGESSCAGQLLVYADGSLVYDSTVHTLVDTFQLPAHTQRLAVHCVGLSDGGIMIAAEQQLTGTWRCTTEQQPVHVWTHRQFNTESWAQARLTSYEHTGLPYSVLLTVDGMTDSDAAAAATEVESTQQLYCYLDFTANEEETFTITSPEGCASLDTTLADMESSCVYRQCIYGLYPWIDTAGDLEITTTPVPCSAGTMVPEGYDGSDTLPNPCTEQGDTCAVCSTLPTYARYAPDQCSYLECEESGYVNPQGRIRYVAALQQCREGFGVGNNYLTGKKVPCTNRLQQCAPPTAPEPVEIETRPVRVEYEFTSCVDRTEYYLGVLVITNIQYTEELSDQTSSRYQQVEEQLRDAIEVMFYELEAEITLHIEAIESDTAGILVRWRLVTVGLAAYSDVSAAVQAALDRGYITSYVVQPPVHLDLTYHQAIGVRSISAHYQITADLDIAFEASLEDTESEEYRDVSSRLSAAVVGLYEDMPGEKIARITNMSPLEMRGSDDPKTRVTIDLTADEPLDEQQVVQIIQDAKQMGHIGEFQVASSIITRN